MASSKKRHYLYILKEADVIKRDMEKNNLAGTSDYEQICTMWDLAFVELLNTKMPFFYMAEDDIVRIAIDEKFFDMSADRLCNFIGKTSFVELMKRTDFKNIDDDDKEDDKESEAFASEFEKLKNKILGGAAVKEEDTSNTQEKTDEKEAKPVQKINNFTPPAVPLGTTIEEVRNYRSQNGTTYAINTTELAFMGLEPGIGTTYTAVMCAMALSNDYKVAYFEFNDTGHIYALAKWILDEEPSGMTSIELGGVDYYFGIDYMTFISDYKDQYDFVVINYGNIQDNNNMSEFIRSGKRFIVASGIDWRLGRLEEFYKNCEYDRTGAIMYLVPLASDEMLDTVKNITSKNTVVSVPYCANPFEPTEEVMQKLFTSLRIEGNHKKEEEVPEKKKGFRFGLKK